MKIERQPFQPSADAVRRIETSAVGVAPDDDALAAWHRTYVTGNAPRVALDLDTVTSQVPPPASVLECGSVPLLLTAALADLGYHVIGCDLAPERYRTAIERKGLRVEKCSIEVDPLPFEDATFAGVIFNELFEHLRMNPIFTLSEVFRVLQPGGRLLLSTPNLKSLGGIRNYVLRDKAYSCSGNIYAEYRKLSDIGHMGHVREYTATEVTEFLGQIGFRVVRRIYRGSYGNAIANATIRALPRLSPFVTYVAERP